VNCSNRRRIVGSDANEPRRHWPAIKTDDLSRARRRGNLDPVGIVLRLPTPCLLFSAVMVGFPFLVGCGGSVATPRHDAGVGGTATGGTGGSSGMPGSGGTAPKVCEASCDGTCIDGRCLVTLASGQDLPFGIAVDSTSVYWVNKGKTNGSGSAMKVSLGGGTPETLAMGQDGPRGIAIDATSVYWSSGYNSNASMMKVGVDGGVPAAITSGQEYAAEIAIDAASIYWTTAASGNVMRVALAGGTSVTLASGQNEPAGIAACDGLSRCTRFLQGAASECEIEIEGRHAPSDTPTERRPARSPGRNRGEARSKIELLAIF
jgi:hypothetical protein